MATLVLNFKNNDVLKMDMKYIENFNMGTHCILNFYAGMIPSDYFTDNADVLIRHNMSTSYGVFSFCDVKNVCF